MGKIYYLVGLVEQPSWGTAIIYFHVKMLREAGHDAYVVNERPSFKMNWISIDVPVMHVDLLPTLSKEDILILPEVLVNMKGLKMLKCRKILFVQASSFLFEMLPENETHISLGFESAIGIMPHMMPIIEQFTGLEADMVRPFIAPYFRKEDDILHQRSKSILIFPKFYQQDFGIVKRVISDKLEKINPNGVTGFFKSKWKLIELKGKTHKEVAKLMQEAAFFIATNTFESFNASCVEAMSAGCISICYEGFGPRDYLVNGKNAYVFPNNEAYQLSNFVFDLIDNYETKQNELRQVREEGYRLASTYNYNETKAQLVNLFEQKYLAS